MEKIDPMEIIGVVAKLTYFLTTVDREDVAGMASCAMALESIHTVERDTFLPKVDYNIKRMLLETPEIADELPSDVVEDILKRNFSETPKDLDTRKASCDIPETILENLFKKGPVS